MYAEQFTSPLGLIEVTASDAGVLSVQFEAQAQHTNQPNRWTSACVEELKSYFEGSLLSFTVTLDQNGTEFQQQVWQALTEVPYGQTASYLDIAKRINNPKAIRAVGSANGRNPIAIIVPCHRIIGSNGTLTGYAGGLDKKSWLLAHEAKHGFKLSS